MVGCGCEVVGCVWVEGMLWCGVEGWRGVLLCFVKPILGNRYGPGVIP